ncbi:hypothetical protein PR048_017798 [Dryococelus australis]|uniref:CST complex subunit CTC1 n=1 Tax=Dryococelus australis TaxID=614101 RepID=A0ABQ9HAL6_9NEOP|nr:hypothetical protein PR048_017798 [Dryococelus australis]
MDGRGAPEKPIGRRRQQVPHPPCAWAHVDRLCRGDSQPRHEINAGAAPFYHRVRAWPHWKRRDKTSSGDTMFSNVSGHIEREKTRRTTCRQILRRSPRSLLESQSVASRVSDTSNMDADKCHAYENVLVRHACKCCKQMGFLQTHVNTKRCIHSATHFVKLGPTDASETSLETENADNTDNSHFTGEENDSILILKRFGLPWQADVTEETIIAHASDIVCGQLAHSTMTVSSWGRLVRPGGDRGTAVGVGLRVCLNASQQKTYVCASVRTSKRDLKPSLNMSDVAAYSVISTHTRHQNGITIQQYLGMPFANQRQRLACSPPNMENLVQFPAGTLPDFRMWRIVPDDAAVGGDPSPIHSGVAPYSFHFILIGSQDLAVKSRPNLYTHAHGPNYFIRALSSEVLILRREWRRTQARHASKENSPGASLAPGIVLMSYSADGTTPEGARGTRVAGSEVERESMCPVMQDLQCHEEFVPTVRHDVTARPYPPSPFTIPRQFPSDKYSVAFRQNPRMASNMLSRRPNGPTSDESSNRIYFARGCICRGDLAPHWLMKNFHRYRDYFVDHRVIVNPASHRSQHRVELTVCAARVHVLFCLLNASSYYVGYVDRCLTVVLLAFFSFRSTNISCKYEKNRPISIEIRLRSHLSELNITKNPTRHLNNMWCEYGLNRSSGLSMMIRTTPGVKIIFYQFGAVMRGWGKREIPEKTHGPTASSGTIPTCENPVTRAGIDPVQFRRLPDTLGFSRKLLTDVVVGTGNDVANLFSSPAHGLSSDLPVANTTVIDMVDGDEHVCLRLNVQYIHPLTAATEDSVAWALMLAECPQSWRLRYLGMSENSLVLPRCGSVAFISGSWRSPISCVSCARAFPYPPEPMACHGHIRIGGMASDTAERRPRLLQPCDATPLEHVQLFKTLGTLRCLLLPTQSECGVQTARTTVEVAVNPTSRKPFTRAFANGVSCLHGCLVRILGTPFARDHVRVISLETEDMLLFDWANRNKVLRYQTSMIRRQTLQALEQKRFGVQLILKSFREKHLSLHITRSVVMTVRIHHAKCSSSASLKLSSPRCLRPPKPLHYLRLSNSISCVHGCLLGTPVAHGARLRNNLAVGTAGFLGRPSRPASHGERRIPPICIALKSAWHNATWPDSLAGRGDSCLPAFGNASPDCGHFTSYQYRLAVKVSVMKTNGDRVSYELPPHAMTLGRLDVCDDKPSIFHTLTPHTDVLVVAIKTKADSSLKTTRYHSTWPHIS